MNIPEQTTRTNSILRNHSLTVRLSDFEFIRVEEQARMAGTTVSEYVRNVLLPDDDTKDTLVGRVARLEAFVAKDREVLERLRKDRSRRGG